MIYIAYSPTYTGRMIYQFTRVYKVESIVIVNTEFVIALSAKYVLIVRTCGCSFLFAHVRTDNQQGTELFRRHCFKQSSRQYMCLTPIRFIDGNCAEPAIHRSFWKVILKRSL